MSEEMKTRLAELIDRERVLMIADVQAAREGTDAGAIHQELAEVRAALKRLRRIVTMKARRTDPIKEVGIRINIDAEEYRRLSDNAAAAAMTLNNYIRYLLKTHG